MKKIPNPTLWMLGLLLFAALARDVLANERPLWCNMGGQLFFPALKGAFTWGEGHQYRGTALEKIEEQNLWSSLPSEQAVFPPIPFTPGDGAGAERNLFPGSSCTQTKGRFSHLLGTDGHGRDVAASMISGARIAVLTGLVAMGVALAIGLLLGLIAGYFGDDRLRVRRGRLWCLLLGCPVAWFYAFPARAAALDGRGGWTELFISASLFCAVLLIFYLLGGMLNRLAFFSKTVLLPADLLIMRLAELFNATPKLLVIVAVGAVAYADRGRSPLIMLGLIGAMSWPGVARFIRAELLKIREMDFMTAARSLGLSDARLMFRHALPNSMRAVMVAFALGVGSAIILEASLSLLGYGASVGHEVSWGALLAAANLSSWWLVIPPGLAICLTVLALNSVGEFFSDHTRNPG